LLHASNIPMKSPQRDVASRRSAGHVNRTHSPKSAALRERAGGRHESNAGTVAWHGASTPNFGTGVWHAETRRLLDGLDGDGKSKAAIPPPLDAVGSCKPVLSNDKNGSVFKESQGMLSEEGTAKLQAVYEETNVMQAKVTRYVEQRLREHDQLWENRIAQEVRKQLSVWSVALQKQEGPFAADALPSALLTSQGRSSETIPCMNRSKSLPCTPAALPPNNVASEQQEDPPEQDLVMQQAVQLVATEQRLEAIEQRLEAAAAKASINASHVGTLRLCSQFSPKCHTSPEQRKQQMQQLPQKALQSHLGVRGASGITREALPAPDRQQSRHRQDGRCSKRCSGRSLSDILEYRRRACEGLPPSSELVPGAEE